MLSILVKMERHVATPLSGSFGDERGVGNTKTERDQYSRNYFYDKRVCGILKSNTIVKYSPIFSVSLFPELIHYINQVQEIWHILKQQPRILSGRCSSKDITVYVT